MSYFHTNFALYSDFPDRDRPEQLSARAQLWVDEHVKCYLAAVEKYPTVENHCNLALARWLGDPAPGKINDYWWQARHTVLHNITTENNVNRSSAFELATINETDLAWRVLRLAVLTMRDESVDRQAYTAFMATAVASAEGNMQLLQLFSSEADQLWQYAIEIGESVDMNSMESNRILLAGLDSSNNQPEPYTPKPFRMRVDIPIPPEVMAQALAMNQSHVMPRDAVDSSRTGLL